MIQPGTRIGRYEVGARLGTGGFGVVYLARDTELGRDLAIKVLRGEYQMQPDVVSRFLKEARAAAKIDHPGIVTVFECGHIVGSNTGADGNEFIAMELLRGESLAARLEHHGRLPLAEAILISRQIAAALAVAHAAGIVHRDLKPDNVFLIPDALVRGGFRVKVLDFGVAKLAEPKESGVNTNSQMLLGTPKYMSPEQARSASRVDHRTDVYTLGCMLYEMLTGQAPYDGPGAIDMIIQHTTAPVRSPAALVPSLPPALDELVRRMLAKEADDRPDSMVAIDAALEDVHREVDRPVAAPRPRPPTPSPPATPPALPPSRPSSPPAGWSAAPTMPAPLAPPVRPTPAPPSRPSAPALPGAEWPTEPVRPSAPRPLPPSGPRPAPPVDPMFAPAASASEAERTAERPVLRTPPPARRRALLATGIAVAVLAAAVTWIALRREPPAGNQTAAAPADAGPPDARITPDAVRAECLELSSRHLWQELLACSDRLALLEPDLGAALHTKAVDEAAAEVQMHRLTQTLAARRFEEANTLVKRIPDDSIYKAEARRRLEAALAERP